MMTAKLRKRKRRIDSKYRPKYARELRQGIRQEGLTVQELCQRWGISMSTYANWQKWEPKFAEAVEIGEVDFQSWWARKYRNVADGIEDGNAGLLQFAAKNVLGWADKTEVKNSFDEELKTIEIIRIAPPQGKLIDHNTQEVIEDAGQGTSSTY